MLVRISRKIYLDSDYKIILFVRSFFFGDVSSKRDPTAYLTYISTLYDHYKKEYCTSNSTEGSNKTELPLVVNTPGWVKGIILATLRVFLNPVLL